MVFLPCWLDKVLLRLSVKISPVVVLSNVSAATLTQPMPRLTPVRIDW